MNVIGGTYSEICFEPIWENIFGSGFRAVSVLIENIPEIEIVFHTCVDVEVLDYLNYYENLNSNLSIAAQQITKCPEFRYDYPLRVPAINPRPDVFLDRQPIIKADGENLLVYGLIEAAFKVKGENVVYDPQSPVNPKLFSSTESSADKLIMIVNLSEAQILTGCNNIDDIVNFLFEEEGCYALVIKLGARGALLFESKSKSPFGIPVYETNKVFPIGSGDVFSAYFAMSWFQGESLRNSVTLASKATAIYCSTKSIPNQELIGQCDYHKLVITETPKDVIYLAGPFFTFSERWLINEIRNALRGFGLRVFSPFHDVGHGKAGDVVHKDLSGLDDSKLVLAIVDGLDPGTLFEVGYAISLAKKVVVYVQNETEESLKMLEGTGCIIERDLTTAIYKTYWEVARK